MNNLFKYGVGNVVFKGYEQVSILQRSNVVNKNYYFVQYTDRAKDANRGGRKWVIEEDLQLNPFEHITNEKINTDPTNLLFGQVTSGKIYSHGITSDKLAYHGLEISAVNPNLLNNMSSYDAHLRIYKLANELKELNDDRIRVMSSLTKQIIQDKMEEKKKERNYYIEELKKVKIRRYGDK